MSEVKLGEQPPAGADADRPERHPLPRLLDKDGKKVAGFALPQTDADLAAKLKGVVP